jgi:hypothetical protein
VKRLVGGPLGLWMTHGNSWARSTRVSHVPHDFPILPEFTTWPTFPFEGDLRVRTVDPAVSEEPPRQGEDPATCAACLTPDSAYLWVSARWRVRSLDRPTGLPMVLILESRSHLDLGDLPNLLAAELGVMTVRLERAVRSLDGVARVHVNRWGDGSAHLHLWFLARPFGQLQLRGTFLSLWDDILPPVPEHRWRENLAYVGAWLAEFGGRTMVEAPHIDWQSPSSIDGPEVADELPDDDSLADVSSDGERPVFEQRATLQAVEAPPEELTHLPLPRLAGSSQESFIVGAKDSDEAPLPWPTHVSSDAAANTLAVDGSPGDSGSGPGEETARRADGTALVGAPHPGVTALDVQGDGYDAGAGAMGAADGSATDNLALPAAVLQAEAMDRATRRVVSHAKARVTQRPTARRRAPSRRRRQRSELRRHERRPHPARAPHPARPQRRRQPIPRRSPHLGQKIRQSQSLRRRATRQSLFRYFPRTRATQTNNGSTTTAPDGCLPTRSATPKIRPTGRWAPRIESKAAKRVRRIDE